MLIIQLMIEVLPWGGSPQLQMLHSFFTLYRQAEALTAKTASMHGATLVVFVGFVGFVNVAWILSVYSAMGVGSTGWVQEGGGGAVEGGRGGVVRQRRGLKAGMPSHSPEERWLEE